MGEETRDGVGNDGWSGIGWRGTRRGGRGGFGNGMDIVTGIGNDGGVGSGGGH